MRYARLSARVDGAAYPCRVQGACAPRYSRRRNSPTDGGDAVPPTPRRGRGTRVGSSQSAVQHDRSATVSEDRRHPTGEPPMPIEIVPTGAEIGGVDLAEPIDDETFTAIERPTMTTA